MTLQECLFVSMRSSVYFWTTDTDMYQADRINQPSPDRDSDCGCRRTRHRRNSLHRRNRPGEWGTSHVSVPFELCIFSSWLPCDHVWTDGMDRDDSYPDQSCPMGNHHRGTMADSHWEDLCSSASICSQSSDEEMKHMGHSKGALYSSVGDTRGYSPKVVNLLPPSGPPVDRGGPPYSGKDCLQSLHRPCLQLAHRGPSHANKVY